MSNQLFTLTHHYQKADKLMMAMCCALFVFTLALASWHSTWIASFVIGLPSVGVALFFYQTSPGSRITRVVFGCVFMVFCALNIHQGHGNLEIHFGIFGLLAVLLFYRDWVPIVAASALIAVHHVAFYFLQSQGANIFVFETVDSFSIVLAHAGYVVFECGVLSYMAISLHQEAEETEQLANINSAVNEGVINLTQRHESKSQMVQGFNNFMAHLDEIIGKSVTIAISLSETGRTLVERNQTVLASAEMQQNDTQKVENAIAEINASSQDIAQHAARAEETAADADQGTTEGLQTINRTKKTIESLSQEVASSCETMAQLLENSQSIGGVLDVIRSIAEQTNLLALNAAIEAARAGEQGRGFAVVADEVRSLASRTQESTAEIQTMIETLQQCSARAASSSEESQKLASQSVEDIQATSEILSSLADKNREIHNMSQNIAATTSQQSALVATINEISSQMHTVATKAFTDSTQSLNACEEQIASACALDQMMKKFLVSK